jgi:hypothetical protein
MPAYASGQASLSKRREKVQFQLLVGFDSADSLISCSLFKTLHVGLQASLQVTSQRWSIPTKSGVIVGTVLPIGQIRHGWIEGMAYLMEQNSPKFIGFAPQSKEEVPLNNKDLKLSARRKWIPPEGHGVGRADSCDQVKSMAFDSPLFDIRHPQCEALLDRTQDLTGVTAADTSD